VTLNEWTAHKKAEIFEDLRAGRGPAEGRYDDAALKEGLTKGEPQMGATEYAPNEVHLEYIFSGPHSSATIVTVAVEPPERIVYLPVPEWVVEEVWQGDVAGSYHFESDALSFMSRLNEDLAPGKNDHWFEKQPAKRRE
jgi:hypothetical protein